MATVGLADTVRVSSVPEQQLTLTVTGSQASAAPTDASNLVIRALESLRQAAGIAAGASVNLVKRVPSQAGLGGGSSDAAAALVAGARVWGLDWSCERLGRLAAELGSDIPYFVQRLMPGGSAWGLATGRGEAVRAVPAPTGQPVVIVKPPEGLRTAAVYGACRPEDYDPDAPRCERLMRAVCAGDSVGVSRAMTNHLQIAAQRVAPWLTRLAETFSLVGCRAHQLSGSGSAYFALTATRREARWLAGRLRSLRLGQVFVTAVA